MFSTNISKSDRVVNEDFTATGTVMGILRSNGTIVIDADDGFIDLSEVSGEWLRIPTPKESATFLKESKAYNRKVTMNAVKVEFAHLVAAVKAHFATHSMVMQESKADFTEQTNLFAGRL